MYLIAICGIYGPAIYQPSHTSRREYRGSSKPYTPTHSLRLVLQHTPCGQASLSREVICRLLVKCMSAYSHVATSRSILIHKASSNERPHCDTPSAVGDW